ncbi:hypothetical protein BD408DRAFT_426056, partial [Parasitella parasitica]
MGNQRMLSFLGNRMPMMCLLSSFPLLSRATCVIMASCSFFFYFKHPRQITAAMFLYAFVEFGFFSLFV